MRPVRHQVARSRSVQLLNQLIGGLAVVLACAAALPGLARADGDPASDVLLVQNVFYPYSPPVSASVHRALDAIVAQAQRAGFAVKVALIASPQDLGAVPMLFGTPQRYADFLEEEIAYNDYPRLIVVMPQGIGLSHVGPRAALAGLSAAQGGDALARAAIQTIIRLASAAGKRLPVPALPASSAAGGGSTPVGLIAAAAAAAVLALALIVALLRRRRSRATLRDHGLLRD